MSVVLRPATPGDVEALARVAHASFHQGFADIMTAESLAQRPLDFFATRFAEQWPHVTVALVDGELLGFSMVRNFHIDMFFVDPAAQGKRIGAAMLRHAEAAGARTLECFRDNHAARGFYEKAGWHLTGGTRRAFCGTEYDFVNYAKTPSAPV